MINTIIIGLFPLWALILCAIALLFPNPFVAAKPAIIPLLTVIMFGMGMTLTWNRFASVVKSPRIIILGVGLQYLIMPFVAFVLSKLFSLSSDVTVGMVLVGSTAGGTASNVISYLARGNVALSIMLTMTSTVLAVLAMPLLTLLYLEHLVPVPFRGMMVSMLQIVAIPVLFGTTINTLWEKRLEKVRGVFPLVSTGGIVVVIAIIVGLNRENLFTVGLVTIISVTLHNLCGLISGYWLPRLFGYDDQTCRTLSIEVGMQNSGMSVALAVKHFSAAAAVPGALFSIWHNISGSILAGYWSRKQEGRPVTNERGEG